MADARAAVPGRVVAPAIELLAVLLLAAGLLAALVVSAGGLHLSWDALNHHIYLGWTAERPRFEQDLLAAGYQSFQFPYLYWPVYKLAVSGANAITAGLALAGLHLLAVPAVWLIARRCMPGNDLVAAAMRTLGVVLAFLTGAVLSLFDVTSNDLLAAIPLVWAIALALLALEPAGRPASLRWVALSGLLAGASVACKLSNGPIAILLPLFGAFAGAPGWRPRLLHVAAGCLATGAGAVLTYGSWGWQLWQRYGNPLYPFQDHLFAPLRAALGWPG